MGKDSDTSPYQPEWENHFCSTSSLFHRYQSRKRFDANSPRRGGRPVLSVHGQNYAKARLPSHHLRVGIRRLVEWDALDHGGHAAQRTETERSVSGRRVPRQRTFEFAAPEYEIHARGLDRLRPNAEDDGDTAGT